MQKNPSGHCWKSSINSSIPWGCWRCVLRNMQASITSLHGRTLTRIGTGLKPRLETGECWKRAPKFLFGDKCRLEKGMASAIWNLETTSSNRKRCSQGRTTPLLILFQTIEASIVLAPLKLGNTYTVNDANAFSYTFICLQFALEPNGLSDLDKDILLAYSSSLVSSFTQNLKDEATQPNSGPWSSLENKAYLLYSSSFSTHVNFRNLSRIVAKGCLLPGEGLKNNYLRT